MQSILIKKERQFSNINSTVHVDLCQLLTTTEGYSTVLCADAKGVPKLSDSQFEAELIVI